MVKINNIDIKLYDGDCNYNNPLINERRIELGLCEYFLNKYTSDVVEVGCVTPYYWESNHIVIDLFDTHIRSMKNDVFEYNYIGKNVLSISTIEHVGTNDYGEYIESKDKAFMALNKIVKESDYHMISIPVGYHKELDKSIAESDLNFFVLNRDVCNNWEIDISKKINYKYGEPFNNANAIIIVTNIEEFKFE